MNERERLLHQIQTTRELVSNIEQLSATFVQISRKPIRYGIPVIVGFIIWFVFLVWLGIFMSSYNYYTTHIFMKFPYGVDALLGSIVIVSIHLGTYLILIKLWNDFFGRIKRSKNVEKLNAIPNQIYKYIEELKYSEIPPNYWNVTKLQSMESYVVNGRADTLKECLNLYEEETMHYQRMVALEEIAYQQRETARQVEASRSEMRNH